MVQQNMISFAWETEVDTSKRIPSELEFSIEAE